MADATDKMREEFEAWIREDSTLPLDRDAYGYSDFTTALMWHAWQAAQAAIAEQGEAVGWYCAGCQCGVDPSEVTFNETHTVCGRIITNDAAPARHADDVAVDQFAAMLKAKLAKARDKGRGGWRDPSWLAADINAQMHVHAAKGDPLDVAAYAMFLTLRGEKATAQQPAQGEAVESMAAIVHYPDHWDTAAYPDAASAIREALFSVGCSECKRTAPPAPSVSVPASTVNELTQDDFTTVLEFQAYRSGFKAGKASQPAQGEAAATGPRFTYGHCADRRQVGGCTRHNLYCGYPDCDRKEVPRG